MSKIKLKNFGPLKEGYQEDGGFMDIKKVTLFIGNQGSGKSTVAKVISTLTWMEKALNRGDFSAPTSVKNFKKHFEFQSLKGYFKNNTVIEYYGDSYSISFNSEDGNYPIIQKNEAGNYTVPQIMYVPAERNFLSVIKNATGVKGLPAPLFEFAEELKRGQNEIDGEEINLPINGVKYKYDQQLDASFIIGNDFNVNLLVASSGFQSLVPLFLVSMNLAQKIKDGPQINSQNFSVDQFMRMHDQIATILNNDIIPEAEKKMLIDEIESKFINKAFVNIVEEPEQNLFPTSQKEILYCLLEFNNLSAANKLIMTTHSPYLINYLTLAVKAESLIDKSMNYKGKVGFQTAISEIVPWNSLLRADDLVIYEFDETNGSIIKLSNYNGIPSDENYLNEKMAEGNELFGKLLDIQELCQ